MVFHQARLDQAAQLAVTAGADSWSADDGTKGCAENHLDLLARMRSRCGPDDWMIALEDDAIVSGGFQVMSAGALVHAPSPVVAFLTCQINHGIGPKQSAFRQAIRECAQRNAAWILAPFLQNAVGYAIHGSIAHDLVSYLHRHVDDEQGGDYPQVISRWCQSRRVRVAYTRPSLVEHSDIPSIIAPALTATRRAWEFGGRYFWDTKHVSLRLS